MIHASWLELLWFGLACAGCLIAFLNLWEARYDWLRFRGDPDPLRRFLSRSVYHAGLIIASKHAVSVAGALWALSHAPPPPIAGESDFWHSQYPGTVLCVTLLSFGMATQAIRSMQWRRQISTGDYDGLGSHSVLRRKEDVLVAKNGIHHNE